MGNITISIISAIVIIVIIVVVIIIIVAAAGMTPITIPADRNVRSSSRIRRRIRILSIICSRCCCIKVSVVHIKSICCCCCGCVKIVLLRWRERRVMLLLLLLLLGVVAGISQLHNSPHHAQNGLMSVVGEYVCLF